MMIETIEADHFPEITENGMGIRRLELLGINEQLRDPHSRREFFANLSDEHYTQMFGYINSITQGQQISYDYEDGILPDTDTPPLEDKGYLMDMTFKTVREITSDPRLDDRAALRRAGLTMAGAINFIHPKENGNGRTGRASHYLMEFGTERGDQAFNEEMYAAIGKLRVYDTDKGVAIRDMPPESLERSLDTQMSKTNPDQLASMSPRQHASARVVAFLDMMRGQTTVPIIEDVSLPASYNGDNSMLNEHIPAGQIDGLSLYEKQYLIFSAIPNRRPDEIPEGSHRVMERRSSRASIAVQVDLV